jgi:hypothetical protein
VDENQSSLTLLTKSVLHDNNIPRYLPHIEHPEVLLMGLSPLGDSQWIETDNDLAQYHQHKLRQREISGDRVYRATPSSLVVQQELADLLLAHLTTEHSELYHLEDNHLRCHPGQFLAPLNSDEPLWNCSLWVADDLVIMEKVEGEYRLTAASLCSPSHWRLEEKFDRPLREIHDPIPDFHRELTPRIDRFFEHLKPEHPVVRFNWSVQAYNDLNQRPEHEVDIEPGTELFYRIERQSLLRLPQSGAVAFTIRVYLHPLQDLAAVPGALPALFAAIDDTSPALAQYKGFDELAPALEKYR